MVDLRDIMLVSPNTLSKNQNFQKLRYDFLDKGTLIITTISSCHWKTLLPICLQKERPENTLLTLTVMIIKLYRKTNYAIQNNTTNWIFNDIMMLFIHCLFWLENWHISANSCKGFRVCFRIWRKCPACLKRASYLGNTSWLDTPKLMKVLVAIDSNRLSSLHIPSWHITVSNFLSEILRVHTW